MALCEKMIYQQLQPQKALNEQFAKLDTDVEKVENMLKFATGILNLLIATQEKEETTDDETVEKVD
ncbi:phage protein [Streptococcus dysgalactiae]|nr:phage protein [Streptococcus dysgalactiae]